MTSGNGISMNFFIDTDTEIGRDFCWNCDFRKGRFWHDLDADFSAFLRVSTPNKSLRLEGYQFGARVVNMSVS